MARSHVMDNSFNMTPQLEKEEYEWSESGLKLLNYITHVANRYGNQNLANIIERELLGNNKCFKRNCAYCNHFNHEPQHTCQPPPVLTVLTESAERIPSNMWLKDEDKRIIESKSMDIDKIEHLFPGRTRIAIQQRRYKLSKTRRNYFSR